MNALLHDYCSFVKVNIVSAVSVWMGCQFIADKYWLRR